MVAALVLGGELLATVGAHTVAGAVGVRAVQQLPFAADLPQVVHEAVPVEEPPVAFHAVAAIRVGADELSHALGLSGTCTEMLFFNCTYHLKN